MEIKKGLVHILYEAVLLFLPSYVQVHYSLVIYWMKQYFYLCS